jgi:hypothetical protein
MYVASVSLFLVPLVSERHGLGQAGPGARRRRCEVLYMTVAQGRIGHVHLVGVCRTQTQDPGPTAVDRGSRIKFAFLFPFRFYF